MQKNSILTVTYYSLKNVNNLLVLASPLHPLTGYGPNITGMILVWSPTKVD